MKVKRKQRIAPRIQQRLVFYYAVTGTVLAAVGGILLFLYLNTGMADDTYAAPPDFTSVRDGAWSDGSTWDTNISPGQDIDNNRHVRVYQYVTRTGNLKLKESSVLRITDTLEITKDLQVDKNAELIIEPGGVLIVRGELKQKSNSRLTVEPEGLLVVFEKLKVDKEVNITNGGVIAVKEKVDIAKDVAYDDTQGGEFFVIGEFKDKSKDQDQIENREDGRALEQQYPSVYEFLQTSNVSALPITLLYFRATVAAQQVRAEWATESEVNNDYFTVERSTDGRQYEVVGTVAGAGTSQDILTYSFTDPDPQPGTSYYRLRQTDFNGQYEVFDWVAVVVERSVATRAALSIKRVAPNPFTTRCSVTFTLDRPGPVTVQLLDAQGVVRLSRTTTGYIGHNHYTLDTLPPLPPGTYLMRVVANQHAEVIRIIKE